MKAERLGCAHSLHITWWKLACSLAAASPSVCRWKSDQWLIRTQDKDWVMFGGNMWTTVGPVLEQKEKMKHQSCFSVSCCSGWRCKCPLEDIHVRSGPLGHQVPPASCSTSQSVTGNTHNRFFSLFCPRLQVNRERGGALLRLTEESGFHFPGLPHQHREETWPRRKEEEQKRD